MAFVIVKKSNPMHPEKELVREDDFIIKCFERLGEAEEFVRTIESEFNTDEHALPNYEVWDAHELLDAEMEVVFKRREDSYTAPESWMPFARAVADNLRFELECFFRRPRKDSIEGPRAFGLQAFAPYSEILVQLHSINGYRCGWDTHLDLSPKWRWVEGVFEPPESLERLASLLNLLHGSKSLEELDLSKLPKFGGRAPRSKGGVLSWDKNNLLARGPSSFEVVTRETWAKWTKG